jgi:CRISPR-associated protein (TIGR03985 family)
MLFPFFSDPPTIALLQWLARGSLKQNLPRAIRLWAWLQFLYGEEGATSKLNDPFTYAEWRDAFFTASHPHDEAVPKRHDPTCRCARTTSDWLFHSTSSISKKSWQKSLQQHDSEPENLEDILQSRLFGVTRRSLYEDLQILCRLGWVKRIGQEYCRVEAFPARALLPTTGRGSIIVHPDLAAIAENLSQEINGYQRFFLHVDYVVPKTAIDQVDEWQEQLRKIWEKATIPPISLTYHSAKLGKLVQSIVYPVCIYYVQRAPYLCAWGQVPGEAPETIDWRNYRLDRIHQLQPLKWINSHIPATLQQAFREKTLPTPDDIQEKMVEAWGFDFYQPSTLMVLRFDHWFYEGYIRGTVRHDTFEQVSYAHVKQLIQTHTPDLAQRQALLQVWRSRSPEDAYYIASYRIGDPNVMLRLRAWRPKIEILLPWELRLKVAIEVEQESRLYHD